MIILGIHGGVTTGQHDPAAALLIDGRLMCAIEEERLNRVKTSTAVLPVESMSACLEDAGISINEVDLLCLPGETYEGIIERTKEWVTHHFGFCPKIETVNHQTAHIASAFYPSGFESAMCISYDAYGDGISGAIAKASRKDGITILDTLPGDNSLGVFYATMTSFLGFKPGEDEYKIMGLAPYGQPTVDLSFFLKPDKHGYTCQHEFFRTRKSATQYEPFYSQKLVDRIGSPRLKNQEINEFYRNVACSTQQALEDAAISLINYYHSKTNETSLCLAGGVALNCTLNGKIIKLPFVKQLFVQPSSSDRGLALGCALYVAAKNGENIQPIDHVFYGPSKPLKNIEYAISLSGYSAKKLNDPASVAAKHIAEGKIICWYQGRSEFGPRALGHRSILADPGIPSMKDQINKKVKFREEFRPFAPSVLEEQYQNLYDLDYPSPFMTVACKVHDKWVDKLPATTHINNTARVQTVSAKTDILYHSLIKHFYSITGRPAVLNTSFNIKGQPIVETPLEAISTFAGNGIDSLFLGEYLLEKA